MRISIDREVCYGSAECVYHAPAVFDFVDDYGVVRPGQEGEGDDPRVREAVERCPSQAISVTEQTE
ncbi:ferredoxin [Streptomyces lanatus]|uniref:Ferredoxin n=1 Tax=Streptomyces lanatus TaxID=66900 RepID=A0ABV1Y0U8_9ACTN|nr:ferredoxin [Streptomyces lanatus]GHH23098.1 hypothetical protein GCM10018780_72110 [Streptomyces lanatus]